MNIPKLFSGQVALVTGSGQGLGKDFAIALAKAGCSVALVDVNIDAIKIVANEIRSTGANCQAWQLDVKNIGECEAVLDLVQNELGTVDILVNNAGISTRAQLEQTEFNDEIDRVMAVNLKGALNMTRACIPQLKKTKGVVVNVASIAALLASFASIPYAASKGAVAQATKFLARDLAAHGIRVNAVAPGFVKTPLTVDLQEGSDSRMHRATTRTMLKRPAEPIDIVGPVLFLASDLSCYLTGVILPVDGGYSSS